jgi:hypothetical protein
VSSGVAIGEELPRALEGRSARWRPARGGRPRIVGPVATDSAVGSAPTGRGARNDARMVPWRHGRGQALGRDRPEAYEGIAIRPRG